MFKRCDRGISVRFPPFLNFSLSLSLSLSLSFFQLSTSHASFSFSPLSSLLSPLRGRVYAEEPILLSLSLSLSLSYFTHTSERVSQTNAMGIRGLNWRNCAAKQVLSQILSVPPSLSFSFSLSYRDFSFVLFFFPTAMSALREDIYASEINQSHFLLPSPPP